MGIFGKRGAVRVELERDVVCAGDVVAGTVFLSVDKAIKAASLKVLVSGQEVLMFKRTIAGTTGYFSKTEDHVKEEIVLVPEKTAFDAGEKQYRFSCHIPPDAQPSFSYVARGVQDLRLVSVNTEYKIDAVLDVQGIGASNLKGEATFTVELPPQKMPPTQAISARHAGDVAFLALFKRGSCELTLDVATNIFVPSSTIQARVGLTLDSASTARSITLVLYEDAVINRRDAILKGLKRGSRVVTKRKFDPRELGTAPFVLELPLTPNEISTDKPLNPTMTAHFLTLTYRLAVECDLAMAGDISIDAPVTIVRETPYEPRRVGAPYGDMAIEAGKILVSAIAG